MENNEKIENTAMNYKELYEIVLDLYKKINDIHRLHFPEEQLKKRKNQKQKFLAEILTSSARNAKKI
ncbi:hypothetical protein OQZ33_04235 [Pedobacter sp. MC2016-05]|uniref:hypothetical protein n=1 Tax=Pedobacter sp. MC2016-05 TaxID=2994474 RepID=UPI002247D886|nr:hypothetical protein [Pedobacter sp. MC2016-05]MCX2473534.1 hypothetical protein [Pedobacter sp. MC2016-05]